VSLNRQKNEPGHSDPIVGVQFSGSSSEKIYDVCCKILVDENAFGGNMLDIGGGKGEFSLRVKERFRHICLLDYSPAAIPEIETRSADLNQIWPVNDSEFDVAIALEVIEHLENPRHFFREILRSVKSGGFLIISTPNQGSIANRFCFLLRCEHQQFQDSCYPAHITALVPRDFERISRELKQLEFLFSFTNSTRIPGTKLYLQSVLPWARGGLFSDNIVFALRVRKLSP